MAKLKDYEAFPKGLGALTYAKKPARKPSARGKRATRNDAIEGAIPLVAGLAVVAFLISRAKKNQGNTTASANTTAPAV
jgi:hypothetical protein